MEPASDNTNTNSVICNAGQSSLCINPYGQVFLCAQFPLQIGDIRQAEINQIWEESEKLQWWRDHNSISLKTECCGCEHFNDCKFCPGQAYTFTGNPLAKYEGACISTELYYNK